MEADSGDSKIWQNGDGQRTEIKKHYSAYHQKISSKPRKFYSFLVRSYHLISFVIFQSHDFPSSNILRTFSSGIPSVLCDGCNGKILRLMSINKIFSAQQVWVPGSFSVMHWKARRLGTNLICAFLISFCWKQ